MRHVYRYVKMKMNVVFQLIAKNVMWRCSNRGGGRESRLEYVELTNNLLWMFYTCLL